jgi:hypothetical protein
MAGSRSGAFAIWAASTILVSAFLLFQVQPIISKMILPWFGGSSAVWTTCMLFFQVVLLLGYGYAHWLTSWFTPRRQAIIHACVAVAALCTLPITPTEVWRPTDGSQPSLRILLVLARHVGLTYFLLSTTGPLVQAWFGRMAPGKSPYRLYALSNIGSLTALLSYPFFFEPRLTLGHQDLLWSTGFAVFAVLLLTLAWQVWRAWNPSQIVEEAIEEKPAPLPTAERKLLWVFLPALASVALLAVTNHLSQDVAAVPFLWVIPLSLYLLSFILCFDSDRWYVRPLFTTLAMLTILTIGLIESAPNLDKHCDRMQWPFHVSTLLESAINGPFDLLRPHFAFLKNADRFTIADFDYNPLFQGLFYLSSLFFGCIVCHGELARLKPAKQHLTEYFLMISAGGALGGVFVALLCPVTFTWYAELPLAQAGMFLVSGVAAALMLFKAFSRDESPSKWLRFGLCAIALAGVGMLSADSTLRSQSDTIRGLASLAMAMVGAALAYGIVATSRKELQVMCAAIAGLIMLSAVFGLVLGNAMKLNEPGLVAAARSFYGALQVKDDEPENPHGRWLTHGRIQHGFQHLGPEMSYEERIALPAEDWPLRYQPATYYVEDSGIGLAVTRHPRYATREKFKIGVVGLGTGTMAAYGREGDEIRFYEIDATVEQLSSQYFTYRQDSLAKTEVVLGDARLQLESEEPQQYDVLAIDAFSGDAIPVHLLTTECLAVYQKHLRPDGILAIHISNRYLDLAPVVRSLAAKGGMQVENFHYREQAGSPLHDTSSEWMLLTKNEAFFNDEFVKAAITTDDSPRLIEWTDEYSNLSDILRW